MSSLWIKRYTGRCARPRKITSLTPAAKTFVPNLSEAHDHIAKGRPLLAILSGLYAEKKIRKPVIKSVPEKTPRFMMRGAVGAKASWTS